tara:strand:+ start:3138 stop:3725 length:588 start_codon:yes stop_codon:yes gene_type:complete
MKRKFFTFKPFIDVLFCCLLMLVAILYLLKTEDNNQKMRPPNVMYQVILTWDGKSEDDLDLWVEASSGHIVSFNRREGGAGSLVSLDHDALGYSRNNRIHGGQDGSVVGKNEEIVSFRGIFVGENTVNVHVYAKVDDEPVTATITLIKIKPFEEIVKKEIVLSADGEEKTAFRFITDGAGSVKEINELPKILTKP